MTLEEIKAYHDQVLTQIDEADELDIGGITIMETCNNYAKKCQIYRMTTECLNSLLEKAIARLERVEGALNDLL
jgi:hypothetical protein